MGDILSFVASTVVFIVLLAVVAVVFKNSVAQVRPTQRCVIERFGKFSRYAESGLVVCIPIVERFYLVDITETMVTCDRQEVITGDNLNAGVSAQVYYKIKADKESVKNSQYNVNDVEYQIVSLAQTTLRNVIGGLTLKEANSQRSKLNIDLQTIIAKETTDWGIEIVRCEIAEIDAPKDVQAAMNNIVKAESEKRAAIDFATAVETKADGEKRAEIKKAEGKAQAITIEADAKAGAIKKVNDAANETFKGPAVELRRLEATEKTFANNTKVFVPEGASIVAMADSAINPAVVPVKA